MNFRDLIKNANNFMNEVYAEKGVKRSGTKPSERRKLDRFGKDTLERQKNARSVIARNIRSEEAFSVVIDSIYSSLLSNLNFKKGFSEGVFYSKQRANDRERNALMEIEITNDYDGSFPSADAGLCGIDVDAEDLETLRSEGAKINLRAGILKINNRGTELEYQIAKQPNGLYDVRLELVNGKYYSNIITKEFKDILMYELSYDKDFGPGVMLLDEPDYDKTEDVIKKILFFGDIRNLMN